MESDNFFPGKQTFNTYWQAGIKGFKMLKVICWPCNFLSVLMFTFPIVLHKVSASSTITEFSYSSTKDVVTSLKIIMNKIICSIYNCVEPLNTGCPTLHHYQKFVSYTQLKLALPCFFPSNHLNKFTLNI